jgi:hypothetical protein
MTCAMVQIVSAGQPCGTVNNQGAFCEAQGNCVGATNGMPGTCRAASALGGPCDLAKGPGCINPSRCVAASGGGTSGTCQVPDASACQ